MVRTHPAPGRAGETGHPRRSVRRERTRPGPMATAHVDGPYAGESRPGVGFRTARRTRRARRSGPLYPDQGTACRGVFLGKGKAKGVSFLRARFFEIFPVNAGRRHSLFLLDGCGRVSLPAVGPPLQPGHLVSVAGQGPGRGSPDPGAEPVEDRKKTASSVSYQRTCIAGTACHSHDPWGVVPEAAVLIDPVRAMDTEADVTHPVGIDMVHRTRSQDAFPRAGCAWSTTVSR